ncbi:MAG: FecR domain-containing protein [Steroidobacteraceae bacterium]|nr:FecR domain-containing protein [Steroidobacteraceae bacterium]MBP7012913.1 FecR domain-containing protein [Steroidobacteraceae bacterium]
MSADMPTVDERRRAATEQAAAWLVALRMGRLSARERDEFVNWLRESPLHIAEMLTVSRVDQALEAFDRWNGIPAAEQVTDNVVSLTSERPRLQPRRKPFMWVSRAIAAGLALVVLATGSWLALRETGTVVRTQLAEQRQLALTDGSIVHIAPLTEMRIRFTRDRRSIELRRGQALFDVSPDPRRPFVVDAGTALVHAVGTSFDVDRAEEVVRVTVIKGRVEVAHGAGPSGAALPKGSTAGESVLLSANESVVVRPRARMSSVLEVNGAAQADWAKGTLVFEDETVAEVVRRFNPHNVAQIKILDPRLAERRISGTFKAADPESFVAFIRATSEDLAHERPVILLDPSTSLIP